jgi:hypothetical protein
MENWNKNDWQGKRKDQVDYAAKALFFGSIVLIIMVIVSAISTFFK